MFNDSACSRADQTFLGSSSMPSCPVSPRPPPLTSLVAQPAFYFEEVRTPGADRWIYYGPPDADPGNLQRSVYLYQDEHIHPTYKHFQKRQGFISLYFEWALF